jgi:hypothetical protein
MNLVARVLKKVHEDGEVFIEAFTVAGGILTKAARDKVIAQGGGVRIAKLTQAGWVAMPGWEIIEDTIDPDWPIVVEEEATR